MNREELTPIELECNMGPDANGVVQREPWKAYDIDEVDILIDKKDSEINELRDECAELHNRVATLLSQIRIRDERIDELKAKLESVQASAYADSVDAGMRDDKKSTDTILDERNAEIAELKADYKEACDRLQTANLIKDEQLAATRHQKYRRCLAMASKCRLRARWFGDNAFYKKEQWALQWHRRWLELAEKFK